MTRKANPFFSYILLLLKTSIVYFGSPTFSLFSPLSICNFFFGSLNPTLYYFTSQKKELLFYSGMAWLDINALAIWSPGPGYSHLLILRFGMI